MLNALLLAGMLCTVGALMPVQKSSPQPSVQLPLDLQRVLTDYEFAWRRHDAHGLSLLFAKDGYVLTEGNPPVKGRDEIERIYTGAGGPLSLHAIAFATEKNLGYIIGGFARREGDPDLGKFTLTLRKDANARWLIVSDMDNSNRKSDTQ